MAPRRAAEQFRADHPDTAAFRVTLYGSLAATGMGHLTDRAIRDAFHPIHVEFHWEPDHPLPLHPNALRFEALFPEGHVAAEWKVYSIGGGALREESPDGATLVPLEPTSTASLYDRHSLSEILAACETSGQTLWEYVLDREGPGIEDFLREAWHAMQDAIRRGIRAEGVLPGPLGLARKAWAFHRRAQTAGPHFRRTALVSAYALAVAEENASGGIVVTAPTCGSSGVLPAVLRYTRETIDCGDAPIRHALATAGLIGNLVKYNASISGAEVGCQGEIGTACAMAAGAAVQLLGGTARQVEYAAEMGLEHHLGLTCDPVAGLVQIPCIERNAFAAARALTCADYALFSDGGHRIPFDEVVVAMRQTGHDLPSLYRETGSGGLAEVFRHRKESR